MPSYHFEEEANRERPKKVRPAKRTNRHYKNAAVFRSLPTGTHLIAKELFWNSRRERGERRYNSARFECELKKAHTKRKAKP